MLIHFADLYKSNFEEERNLFYMYLIGLQSITLFHWVDVSIMFLNHELTSLDNKFYKNTNKPINQNENFVIEHLDYASNRLIFDYNRWLEHH
jgi:hypothetical protein